jgi:hypothetical protein
MSKIINQLLLIYTSASRHNDPRVIFLPMIFRHLTIGLLFTFYFLFLTLSSCGFDIEDPTPPSPPVWVQKSLPEEWPERGIDAHESGGIFLEWEPSPDEDIVAYHIFRASLFESKDSLGDFDLIDRMAMEPITPTEYIDVKTINGSQYFYKLKAENSSKNLSKYSDPVTYRILPEISIGSMTPNGMGVQLEPDRSLHWVYPYAIAMEQYCLTILTQENNFVFRKVFSPSNYTGENESQRIPSSINLDSNHVYKWRVDTSAYFEGGLEIYGSESSWAVFVY